MAQPLTDIVQVVNTEADRNWWGLQREVWKLREQKKVAITALERIRSVAQPLTELGTTHQVYWTVSNDALAQLNPTVAPKELAQQSIEEGF